jgi:hypothetical protein
VEDPVDVVRSTKYRKTRKTRKASTATVISSSSLAETQKTFPRKILIPHPRKETSKVTLPSNLRLGKKTTRRIREIQMAMPVLITAKRHVALASQDT